MIYTLRSKPEKTSIKRAKANALPDRAGDGYSVFTKLTIESNVDNADFWAFKDTYYGANTLISGFAQMGGNPVLIMGPDTNNGISTTASVNKAREVLRIALKTATHQILIHGKNWYRPKSINQTSNLRARSDFLKTLHKKNGLRINIITDAEGLKCVDITSNSDFIIFVADKNISEVNLNFAKKNSSFMVDNISSAFDLSCKLINYFSLRQSNIIEKPKNKVDIPIDAGQPYDMIEKVIMRAFDHETFTEIGKDMNDPIAGPNLITGLARLNGKTVGIIADQPMMKGGGADSAGTEKFRVFVEILNANRIPLVMLSNSSGFVPGSKEERYRIQAIGADSLDVNIEGSIPVVSVVLNQNFGGRMIHAFNKYLRPGIVYIALDSAIIAVLGETVAFDLLKKKEFNKLMDEGKTKEAEQFYKDAIQEYKSKARAENDAYSTGVLDFIVKDRENLREYLVKAMDEAELGIRN